MTKIRVDSLLVERNLAETREKAKRLIMAGLVFNEHERLDKPGTKINDDILLYVKGQALPYVGRGGLKLEKAIEAFSLDLKDRVVIDIGSSTGGFTDCALQYGAQFSYAVDVGYNQLSWKLRNDERVAVMERTNFRYVTPNMIQFDWPNFAAIDVSFISLTLLLPVLTNLLQSNSDVIILIKPQFEAGRDQVGKKGIVHDKYVHADVLDRIISFSKKEGYQLLDITYSPVTGGDGNIEFLAHLGWGKVQTNNQKQSYDTKALVDKAHAELRMK